MTATQAPFRPTVASRTELLCRPLVAMAARGFDPACLLEMQVTAFRHTAQFFQHLTSAGKDNAGADLQALVDRNLGGTGQADAEYTPGHIAAYMVTKAFLTQFPQRDAMFNVSAIKLVEPATAPRNYWLAVNLTNLLSESERLAMTTPIFASEISTLVEETLASSSEIGDLFATLQVSSAPFNEMTADEQPDESDRAGINNC
ncbi:hypothetical protein JAB5_58420 [Janthinobacterium sp. HH103]|nr:hypothetical protein JAB5_58420 [Janthinobacterium sp. HH103]OEZ68575.1 hypothetical protein JAB2_17690 [Janthinobacterium sp. HH100]QOU76257.1 hypothetical protein JAB4_057570 [Janthinobacterium sp. HH102]